MRLRIPNKLHHEIIPGILEQNWEEIAKKISLVYPFTAHVHVDVVDGIFAETKTWIEPKPFSEFTRSGALSRSQITLEAHLMVDDPLQYLESFSQAGFTRFIGHIERMPDLSEFVAQGQLLGEVGLGLDIASSVDVLTQQVKDIEDIDFVLVMLTKAGMSRQQLLPEMLEKVKKLRSLDPLLPIEVDGGINEKTIIDAKNAGATRFVTTGFIFDGESPEEQYQILDRLVK